MIPTGNDTLAFENAAVLMTVQAMAGLVGADWDAVTVQVAGGIVLLRVWVDDPAAAAEDVDDLVFELEALALGEGLQVRLELSAGTPRPYRREEHGRLVYLRRIPGFGREGPTR